MYKDAASAVALCGQLRDRITASGDREIGVAPPFPMLPLVRQRLDNTRIRVGGQNLHPHREGAFTGEVAAEMLVSVGCSFVIVGHSERRHLYGERDVQVAEKFAAAQRVGLVPILCLGETLGEREQGATEEVVGRQLQAVLSVTGVGAFADAVIAYEPVWAIGTGRTAGPEQAQAVHVFIRARVGAADAGVAERLALLYGGSVKPANAPVLFAMPDVDGGLIGGASLLAEDFLAICRAAMPEGNCGETEGN